MPEGEAVITLRARRQHLFTSAAALVVFLVPAIYVMSLQRGVIGFFVGLGALGVSVLVVREDLLPVWRARLTISDRSISWHQGDRVAELALDDVLAATIEADRLGRRILLLATQGGVAHIAVQHFDRVRLAAILADKLGAERWGDASFARWAQQQPEHRAAEQADSKAISELTQALRVHQRRWVHLIGWAGVAFFGLSALLSLLARSFGSSAIFAVFAFLSVFNALSERLELDAGGITRTAPPLGEFRIRWEDVRRVEHSPMFEWIVFYGDDKRLACMGPAFWSGPDATAAVAFLRAQVRQRSIPVRSHWLVQFKIFSRNTRVRR